jgi:hypothetical protein
MKLLVTLLLAVVSIPAWSQKDGDSSASCITYWKKGETKVYSIVHEKMAYGKDSARKLFSFSYEAQVTVLDSTADDYTIKWVFHNPALTQAPPVLEGMQVIFRITPVGTFAELLNWEEVRDGYVQLMDLSLPKQRDSIMTSIMDKEKALYSTRENVESALIQEIQLFHLPYGYKFTTQPVNEKTQLSSPFGNDPLPAVQTHQVTQLDRRKDRYTLVIRQQIDSNSLGGFIDALMKKMGIKGDGEIRAAKAQLTTLIIKDYSEYQFIWSSGWIRRLYYLRTAGSAALKQSDAYTITLKD